MARLYDLYLGTASPSKKAPKMVCTPMISVKNADAKMHTKVTARADFWFFFGGERAGSGRESERKGGTRADSGRRGVRPSII
jgi:hypothetical protein